MYERSYGAKYDKSISTTEIAKRFRADVKAALAAGELPKGLKVSIRTSYFSGGSSIDVRIVSAPFSIMNKKRIEHDVRTPNAPLSDDERPLHSERAREVLATLEGMLQAYNHDGSEIQSDYFDVRFYGHVNFEHEQERAERAAVEALVPAAEPVAAVAR
ncbi:MAG: hypothetical protein M3167_06030 [Acidobacteriota bacterium]|nr:hypothetical protein [Acidobacteriota bacterium]